MALPIRRHRGLEQWTPWAGRSWDPFSDFQQLWDQMGRFFATTAAEVEAGTWRPLAETEETDDAYVVRAELPGFSRDDVQVEITGNELRISGEAKEEEHGKVLRQRTGKFMYHSTLPADADVDKVDGELVDGVLTVRVPKIEQSKSRRIALKG